MGLSTKSMRLYKVESDWGKTYLKVSGMVKRINTKQQPAKIVITQ